MNFIKKNYFLSFCVCVCEVCEVLDSTLHFGEISRDKVSKRSL